MIYEPSDAARTLSASALGTTMLGVATAGVGILVGGVIFSITGSTISQKAEKTYEEMLEAEKEINKVLSMDCTAIGKKVLSEFVNFVNEANEESLDSLIHRRRK